MKVKKVAIIMGSINDRRVMKEASVALKKLKVPHEIFVVSAHRTPEFMFQFAKSADKSGFDVIIAGAGGAAHLPGMVACLTHLPVIGVPITVGKLKGLDALLSIAQMPKGVPVACVAVDNAFNAGLLAARILALQDSRLCKALQQFREKNRKKVLTGSPKT